MFLPFSRSAGQAEERQKIIDPINPVNLVKNKHYNSAQPTNYYNGALTMRMDKSSEFSTKFQQVQL